MKCISAEWAVKFHLGYEFDENDYRDVSALCERFGIALPVEYERFTRQDIGDMWTFTDKSIKNDACQSA